MLPCCPALGARLALDGSAHFELSRSDLRAHSPISQVSLRRSPSSPGGLSVLLTGGPGTGPLSVRGTLPSVAGGRERSAVAVDPFIQSFTLLLFAPHRVTHDLLVHCFSDNTSFDLRPDFVIQLSADGVDVEQTAARPAAPRDGTSRGAHEGLRDDVRVRDGLKDPSTTSVTPHSWGRPRPERLEPSGYTRV